MVEDRPRRRIDPVRFLVFYVAILAVPFGVAMVSTQAMGEETFTEIFLPAALVFGIFGGVAGMFGARYATGRRWRIRGALPVFAATGVAGSALMSLGFVQGWFFSGPCMVFVLFLCYGVGVVVLPGLLGLWFCSAFLIVDREQETGS